MRAELGTLTLMSFPVIRLAAGGGPPLLLLAPVPTVVSELETDPMGLRPLSLVSPSLELLKGEKF